MDCNAVMIYDKNAATEGNSDKVHEVKQHGICA